MTVHCPHCSTGYVLPEHLLGPGGSRVRCPSCGETFLVTHEIAAPAEDPDPSVEGGPIAPAEPSPDPERVADEVLAEFEARLGSRLAKASRRGRVLAEIGPELMACFDEYRARAGSEASADVFRRVLRERLGVSLDRRDG